MLFTGPVSAYGMSNVPVAGVKFGFVFDMIVPAVLVLLRYNCRWSAWLSTFGKCSAAPAKLAGKLVPPDTLE